jgi:hypothetical protein
VGIHASLIEQGVLASYSNPSFTTPKDAQLDACVAELNGLAVGKTKFWTTKLAENWWVFYTRFESLTTPK